MTAAPPRGDADIQQALLEGTRDRLRSLGPTDRSEALLALSALREGAQAASLLHLLPLLDGLSNDLVRGRGGAVERALAVVQEQLLLLGRGRPVVECEEDLSECFAQEAKGHLASIRAELPRLRVLPGDRRALDSLSRALHTLKGAAAMVGRTETAQAAHLLEELLKEASLRQGPPGLPWLRRLEQSVDLLEQLIERPEQARELGVALLVLLGERALGPAAAPRRRASSMPPPTTLARREDQATIALGWDEARALIGQSQGTCGLATLCARDAVGLRGLIAALDDDVDALFEATASEGASAAEEAMDLLRRLRATTEALDATAARLERGSSSLERAAGRVDRGLRELELVQAAWIFDRLEAAAEEVGLQLGGRHVEIRREGAALTMDRALALWVLSPLRHLVRNALAHGLEEPSQRSALGKKPSGRVTLSARAGAGWIAFAVRDDGVGIDVERLRERAVALAIRRATEAAAADDRTVVSWIFEPGLSTRLEVDEVAGRGIGLDAVRAEVTGRGGEVDVETEPGRGTQFEIRLPLPTSALDVLLVEAAGQRLAIPLEAVRETAWLLAPCGDERVLAEALGEPPGSAGQPRAKVVTRAGSLLVEAVLGVERVDLSTLGGLLSSSGPYLGVGTRSGDRRPLVVVDVEALSRPVVVLAEDSPTTRQHLAAALRATGLSVAEVKDGREAWERLSRGACSLLVTDLEMPRLDGLELLRRVRRDPALSAMPVIVVTASREPSLRQEIEELGVEAFVEKRQGPSALVSATRAALSLAAPSSGKPEEGEPR